MTMKIKMLDDGPFFIRSPLPTRPLQFCTQLQLIAAENTASNIKKASFWQKICLPDDKLTAAHVFLSRICANDAESQEILCLRVRSSLGYTSSPRSRHEVPQITARNAFYDPQ